MNAFLFIPLLALTWAFGFALLTISAHYFLVVLEGTAAGNEEVVLPDEPMTDWFGKGFYLAVLGIIWGAPGVILAWSAGRGSPPLQLALLIGWLWLLFPIGMLSSLCASTRWLPLWPGLFGRMAQRPGKVLAFYAVSLPVFATFGVGFYLLAVRKETGFAEVFLLAPVAAVAFLLYARVLGRMGLVLMFTRGARDAAPAKAKARKRPRRAVMVTPAVSEELPTGPVQPSAMPGIMTPMDGEVTGYDVQFGDRPAASEPQPLAPRPTADPDEDTTPLRMEDAADADDQVRSPSPAQERALKPPSQKELELYDHSARVVKEPASPFGAACFGFLVQPGPLSACVRLSLGFAILGVLICSLRALRPM